MDTKNDPIHEELTSVLVNERTYAAWMRTGLTMLVTGLAVEKFLNGTLPNPFVRTISMLLLLCSSTSFFLGAWRYTHVGRRLVTTRVVGASIPILVTMSIFALLVVGLATIGVWL